MTCCEITCPKQPLKGDTSTVDLKKTPLYPLYAEFGAKTVEFGGWDMPVQFSSILQEHEAVRTKAGLFDVSHMGEFQVTGAEAAHFLQHVVTNDVGKLKPGMAMYSPMTNHQGGCVDDLLIYCFTVDKYWVVVNAGNIDKDFQWLSNHADGFDVHLENHSAGIALLALQGPLSETILQPLTTVDLSQLQFYRFVEGEVAGMSMVISRTGYTGEDGFEMYVDAVHSGSLWRQLMDQGSPVGLIPCGLGARDTLRLEAKLPLYGHELTDDITPLEAGLGMFVKLDVGDFVGRDVLAKQKEDGVSRKIVGVQLLERGIPRADYRVFSGEKEVGFFTSGTMSPTLKTAIGLALVDIDVSAVDTPLEVDIRGKRVPATVVKTPFYKRAR
jgi:aminomethyltransferase